MGRPPVDVVVPFAGSRGDAADLDAALRRLARQPGDSIVIADNTVSGAARTQLSGEPGVEVVRAAGERSSYHARNVGAAAGGAEWILFTDADCVPDPDLLDRYLAAPVPDAVAILAGAVTAGGDEVTPAARYAASRGHIGEIAHIEGGPFPAGVTANLMVRRRAFEQVGGFAEGVRSGADLDLCWRLQAAGWELRHAPGAAVRHRHPGSVAAMLAKARRHGAGRAWLQRRWPGSAPRPGLLRPYVRAPLAALVLALRGESERARFKLLDLRHTTAVRRGYRDDNRAPPIS